MSNRHRSKPQSIVSRIFPYTVVFLLIIILSSYFPHDQAFAQGILSVTPQSGPAGMSVTLIGSSWTLSNSPYEIHWETQDGPQLGSFSPSGAGIWSAQITIPSSASPGAHTIWACEGCGGEFQSWASTIFTVATPPSPTPPPPTPTFTITPTRLPTWTPTPSPTPTELPSVCGDLGLGPDAVVIDFERYSAGTVANRELADEFGVSFERSLEITSPSVATRSGSKAGKSIEGMEFGSGLLPIRFSFNRGIQAIGMFVGLEEAIWTEDNVHPILTVFGFRGGEGGLVELGSSSIVFPAEPMDIKHCLSFEADEGDVISRASLEYVTDEGVSMAEPRLMDDLTLVYSTIELPEDLPPTVEITAPENEKSYVGGSVDVRAEIREDRDLVRVWYTINDGSRNDLGFSTAAGDLTFYLTGFSRSMADFTPYEASTITVHARDSAGQEGSDSVTIYYDPPTPTPSLDIIPVGYEITQVIQCLNNPVCTDNSMPLYINKPTLVRYYVRAEGATAEVPNVSGEICWEDDCRSSLNRISVTTTDDPIRDYRGDIDRTLNFLLPMSWVDEVMSQSLTIHVNRDGVDVPECCLNNNDWRMYYRLIEGRRLNVVMMRVQAHGHTTTGDQRRQGLQWVFRYYPTSNVHVYRSSDEPISASYDYTTKDGWEDLLTDLWWSNFWTSDGASYLRYHGMVPPEVSFNSPGIGYTPGDESAAIWFFRDGGSTAHELGHNHGLRHAPSDKDATGAVSNPNCSDPANPNNSYPQYTDVAGVDYPRSSIGDWGIDLYTSPIELKDPQTTYDLMAYCHPRFMSIYTYPSLATRINRVAALEQVPASSGKVSRILYDPNQEFIIGGGKINPTGFELTHGFYRVPLPDDIEPFPDEGPYAIELRDAAGEVLLTRAFAIQPNSELESEIEGSFKVIVPWVEGTSLIAFLYEGQTIGGVPVSSNAPEIRLLEPNGGESWPESREVTVRWEASDADGDELLTTVQVSADGGETWRALARDIADDRVRIDSSLVPGSDQAIIRVCATDGVNTTCDTSDEPFSVASKGPEIFIDAPMDQTRFPTGEQVIFQAIATDIKDGSIEPEESYVWESSLDGQIGIGPLIWGLPLSAGRHTITLTVTNAEGISTSDSVAIIIGLEETTATGEGPGLLPLILVGTGLLILIGIGVALIYTGIKRSRA